jgi:hypothetical protein
VTQPSDERMARLVEALEQSPGIAEGMPAQEGSIVRDAMNGMTVYQIAQQHQTSERAVWDILGNAARAAAGRGVQRVEIGSANTGVDTDAGVTGSYGETGFGNRGTGEPLETLDTPPPSGDATH